MNVFSSFISRGSKTFATISYRSIRNSSKVILLEKVGTSDKNLKRKITSSHSSGNEENRKEISATLATIFGISGVTVGYMIFYFLEKRSKWKIPSVENDEAKNGNLLPYEKWHLTERKDLPTFTMDEVRKHDSLKSEVWVTYGVGVYNITKFIPEHPGSEKIMLGAGNAIDPFWHVYQQHYTEQILTLLETFRIGNLNPDDDVGVKDLGSPWANEPKRNTILKPASVRPFNAEPPISILTDSFYTPTEFFYVRNHLPVPKIDVNEYELEVDIEGANSDGKSFKFEDLKKLKSHTITAAVMCGGNRRSEMNEVKEVKGLSWGAAAVGNAKWTGVRLSDLLKDMGVKYDEKKHVIFEGADLDPTGTPYAASIPLSKAIDENGEVLLAYEMNGEPLTRDHGFPIRAIVPGVVGARNVKWLHRIIISDNESDSHWQQNDYKGFNPSVTWENVDFSKSPAIQNMPVTSAICSPKGGDKIKIEDGFITVKGYAWSGGGNRVVRVDLTVDKGENWHEAKLEQENDPAGKHWGWSLWTARIPIQNKLSEIEIWSKAVDSNYNCQPESFKNIWNLRGVLSNAYHKVQVKLI